MGWKYKIIIIFFMCLCSLFFLRSDENRILCEGLREHQQKGRQNIVDNCKARLGYETVFQALNISEYQSINCQKKKNSKCGKNMLGLELGYPLIHFSKIWPKPSWYVLISVPDLIGKTYFIFLLIFLLLQGRDTSCSAFILGSAVYLVASVAQHGTTSNCASMCASAPVVQS